MGATIVSRYVVSVKSSIVQPKKGYWSNPMLLFNLNYQGVYHLFTIQDNSCIMELANISVSKSLIVAAILDHKKPLITRTRTASYTME